MAREGSSIVKCAVAAQPSPDWPIREQPLRYGYSSGLLGGGGFNTPSQKSGWTWMNGRIPAAYPSYQTPEVLWMERFRGSGIIGRFDQLQ